MKIPTCLFLTAFSRLDVGVAYYEDPVSTNSRRTKFGARKLLLKSLPEFFLNPSGYYFSPTKLQTTLSSSKKALTRPKTLPGQSLNLCKKIIALFYSTKVLSDKLFKIEIENVKP